MASPARRRIAAPTRPKPAISIVHDAGSGTVATSLSCSIVMKPFRTELRRANISWPRLKVVPVAIWPALPALPVPPLPPRPPLFPRPIVVVSKTVAERLYKPTAPRRPLGPPSIPDAPSVSSVKFEQRKQNSTIRLDAPLPPRPPAPPAPLVPPTPPLPPLAPIKPRT